MLTYVSCYFSRFETVPVDQPEYQAISFTGQLVRVLDDVKECLDLVFRDFGFASFLRQCYSRRHHLDACISLVSRHDLSFSVSWVRLSNGLAKVALCALLKDTRAENV